MKNLEMPRLLSAQGKIDSVRHPSKIEQKWSSFDWIFIARSEYAVVFRNSY